jgi:hypothetical protein
MIAVYTGWCAEDNDALLWRFVFVADFGFVAFHESPQEWFFNS